MPDIAHIRLNVARLICRCCGAGFTATWADGEQRVRCGVCGGTQSAPEGAPQPAPDRASD